MTPELAAALAAALGATVEAAQPVGGGDVAQSYRVPLDDGRTVFAKTHPDAPPLFFSTEAAGLEALRRAHAVAVPEVLATADGPVPFLALEWIEEAGRHLADEAAFGAALAALHDTPVPAFGREDRRSTGSRGLPNEPCATWAEFYATQRLLPLADLAAHAGALPADAVEALRRLADDLDRFGLDGPPSLLHGDLWAGNRIVDTAGRSWLIDPAMHAGNREFDLAMMRLFGGFGPDCHAAYQDRHPLRDGWEERVPLHQIAPLVVHAIKFGGGYVAAATDAIAHYA